MEDAIPPLLQHHITAHEQRTSHTPQSHTQPITVDDTIPPNLTHTAPTITHNNTHHTRTNSPQPTSAHIPATVGTPTTPVRAAARQLQHLHHVHNVANHYADQHPKRQQLGPPADPQPIAKRRLHASPTTQHPARVEADSKPAPVTTILDTISPVTQEELEEILTETQSKYNPHVPKRGLMYPGRLAQKHPAGAMLRQFGTEGCPVEIEEDWSIEQLDQAVDYGAHPSAEAVEAARCCRAEALEKVKQKFVRLEPWSKIRKLILAGLFKNTKVSPIAAIPHKSRAFRMILDLSNKGQRRKGQTQTKSVNELTDEDAAPHHSMDQLGAVLHRCIYAVATRPDEDGPILFCKLDIKDGYWRMCVPESEEEQFCYVLPKTPEAPPDEEIMLVVPAALQMGWTSSPAFFCAATETGRDVAEWLRLQSALPPHPLEHHMLEPMREELLHHFPFPNLGPTANPTPEQVQKFYHLFEVYVDDYIALLQSNDPLVVRHHSRALLHAIHQIFPPPTATGHDGEDPISYKKLAVEGEGIWDTRKEILGWMFDGLNRTMELPAKKVASLRDTIKATLRSNHMDLKAFESFIGKCQHACLGIPGGTAFMGPLYRALHATKRANKSSVQIHPKSPQHRALMDLRTIFKLIGAKPIRCKQLIPGTPHYVGYTDACKYGAGGIWLSGTATLHPIVWRHKWPPEVVRRYEQGLITINDLEMAGLLLHYLLLEQLVPMKDTHTAAWCDNTSAVAWVQRMNSKRSMVGQQLTRALAIRLIANQSSHLAALSIAGKDNDLADLASRSFKHTGIRGNYALNDNNFLTKFNSDFPLTQNGSWLLLRLHNKIASNVCMLLLGKTPPMESWIRLKECGCDIGRIGPTSAAPSIKWTLFSEELRHQTKLHSSKLSPAMSVKGMQDEDIKSAMAQFRTRYAPSARPSRWHSSPTPPTSREPTGHTGTPSSKC